MRQFLSILLLLCVFASSFHIGFGVHLCGERVKNIALLQEAQKCNHYKKEEPKGDCSVERKSCCADRYICADLDTENFGSEEEPNPAIDYTIVHNYSQGLVSHTYQGENHASCSDPPPKLTSCHYLLFQVFRI